MNVWAAEFGELGALGFTVVHRLGFSISCIKLFKGVLRS